MAVILGMLALGIRVLVPGVLGAEIDRSREAMAVALARDLAARHRDPPATRRHLRELLAVEGVTGAAAWDRGGGEIAAGSLPGFPPFPGTIGPTFGGARRTDTEAGPVLVEPSADGDGAAAVRIVSAGRRGALRSLEALLLLYLGLSAVAVVVFGYIALTRLIVRPIDRLTAAARRLADGRAPPAVDPQGGREVFDLTAVFNVMAREVASHREALESKVESLERLNRDLERAQEQVIRSAKLASVGRLASGIAHEIGNPLTVMLGFFEILEGSDSLPPDARRYLASMRSEAERVNRIIRGLLDYARADPEPLETVVVGEVVDATVALLAPQKPFRAVEIQVTVPADLPPVRANRDRLRQVLVNLLMNAADAIGDGPGTVNVRADRTAEGTVRLRVGDSGPGIDPSLLDFVFDPFVTTKEPGAGTGLGLSVCQGIVEGFGGTIRAANDPSGGAILEVILPAAPGEAGPPE
jgi:signal transduction histidine kinase